MSSVLAGGWRRVGTRPYLGLERVRDGVREYVSCGPGSWYTGEVGADGEPVASGRTRSTTATRGRRSAARSISAVRFTARGLEQLYREVMESLDGREAAGGLYGFEKDGEVVIDGVAPPWPSAMRTSVGTEINIDHILAFETPDAAWIGDWHTHPNPDSFTCSDADERTWRRSASLVHNSYVGVIAFTGDDDGRNPYYKPGLRAWAATAAGVHAVPVEFEGE